MVICYSSNREGAGGSGRPRTGAGGHLGCPGSLAGPRGGQNTEADPAAGKGLPGAGIRVRLSILAGQSSTVS